jgi:hypothetical protein
MPTDASGRSRARAGARNSQVGPCFGPRNRMRKATIVDTESEAETRQPDVAALKALHGQITAARQPTASAQA